jgi:uncharacterized membrane protein
MAAEAYVRNRSARERQSDIDDTSMKTTTIAGSLLILLGVVALMYQGITYTKREKLLDLGPIHAMTETQKTIPLPPLVGGLALVGGIVILVLGARRSEGKGIL